MPKPFLTAEWRKLAMANYSVPPEVFVPHVPAGTEIDLWEDTCVVSLVGFMFMETRLKGIKVPFHVNFEEVNLRFCVRHKAVDGWRRGVVFIKEIVPKPALTMVANLVYGEHYETMPMRHRWTVEGDLRTVEYGWRHRQHWNRFLVMTGNDAVPISGGSEEEFITEHYWGYTKLDKGKTSEYGVEHPRWDVYQTVDYAIDVDFGALYGDAFAFLAQEKPRSVFLAEGSAIIVRDGRTIQ